jgi:hypothetical protein
MTNKNIAAAAVANRRSAARQRAGQLESFYQAIALMLDWTVDLDNWIVANQKAHRSKGHWESIYEAAVVGRDDMADQGGGGRANCRRRTFYQARAANRVGADAAALR